MATPYHDLTRYRPSIWPPHMMISDPLTELVTGFYHGVKSRYANIARLSCHQAATYGQLTQ